MVPLAFLIPVLAGIGITGLAAAIISGVAAIALNIGISLLVGSIAQALNPKPGLKSTLTVSMNANDPRRTIIARAATAGALVTFQTWGSNNEWIVLIFRLADHKCQGLAPQINITGTLTNGSDTITGVSSTAGITVGMPIVSYGSNTRFPAGTFVVAIPSGSTIKMSNQALVNLTATPIVVSCGLYWSGNPVILGAGGAVPQFNADGRDNCWVTFSNGDWNQSADADMVANSGGRWSSNTRGRGVAYMKVKARADVKAFPQGISTLFQFVAVVDGYAMYDRRLDSSVGGSGSQRFNDQSTWTLSGNSIVAAENLLRGIRVEDTSAPVGSRASDTFFGLTLTDADLPFAEGVAAMNICDASFALLAGGSQPTFRCNGVIAPNAGETFDTALADVLATASAKLVQSPGRIFMLPAAAQTSVRTFTDADFRLDGPSKLVNDIALSEIANAVVGQFADPASMFSGQPLPPRISLTDAQTDKGFKVTTLDLSYVTAQVQGQYLQEILRRRQRLPITGQRAVAPENIDLEAGDWFTWQSDRFGWTKTFEIVQADGKGAANPEELGMIVLDFAETATSVTSWTPAVDELSRFRPALLPSADPSSVSVTSLAAAVTTLADVSGGLAPAIAVTTDPLNDPTVIGIRFQYQSVGGPTQVLTKDFAINQATASGTQSYTLSDGVVPGFQYQVRATPLRNPPQDDNYTSWVTTSGVTAALTTSANLPVNLTSGQGYTFDPVSPLSAASSTSISVAATTLSMPGRTLSLPSGTITGLTASTFYAVFYDLQASAYVAIPNGSATAYYTNTTRYVSMGLAATLTGGGTPPSPPAPPPGVYGGGITMGQIFV